MKVGVIGFGGLGNMAVKLALAMGALTARLQRQHKVEQPEEPQHKPAPADTATG